MDDYTTEAKRIIGEQMQRAIETRGMSKSEISRATGLSRATIDRILAGRSDSLESLIKMSRVLQLHVEASLMEWDNTVHTMISKTKPRLN